MDEEDKRKSRQITAAVIVCHIVRIGRTNAMLVVVIHSQWHKVHIPRLGPNAAYLLRLLVSKINAPPRTEGQYQDVPAKYISVIRDIVLWILKSIAIHFGHLPIKRCFDPFAYLFEL